MPKNNFAVQLQHGQVVDDFEQPEFPSQAAQYGYKFLTAAMFNAYWPATAMFFVGLAYPPAGEAIQETMKKAFGNYAMAYFQLINLAISAVAAGIFQACMKPVANPNGLVHLEVAPAIKFESIKPFTVKEAMVFCALLYGTQGAAGVLLGQGLETHVVGSVVFNLAKNPTAMFFLGLLAANKMGRATPAVVVEDDLEEAGRNVGRTSKTSLSANDASSANFAQLRFKPDEEKIASNRESQLSVNGNDQPGSRTASMLARLSALTTPRRSTSKLDHPVEGTPLNSSFHSVKSF